MTKCETKAPEYTNTGGKSATQVSKGIAVEDIAMVLIGSAVLSEFADSSETDVVNKTCE